jgi:aminopeptidase C
MNRIVLLSICLSAFVSIFSQEEVKLSQSQESAFTAIKEIPITPVKNQSSSGTCWSFSGLGMIEAELLRQGKGEYDLSEMFIVHKNYEEKAQKYIRMNGYLNFGEGGSFADVLDCIKNHGIVPEEIQTGLNYGEDLHTHGELSQLLKTYLDVIIKKPNKKRISTAWYKGYTGVLDAYLGVCPQSFTYKGKQYTPQSFAQYLGLDADNYISITSFTHHPFYTTFSLEIPDNWRGADSYNLPLNEMMQVIDNAIDKGYTIAWAADVSEKGFSRKGGTAKIIEETVEMGSDQSRWGSVSKEKENQSNASVTSLPVKEKTITQEMRQQGFDNYETTDDHGMLLYGIAQDSIGTKYYMVKNSWGSDNTYKGSWYVSVPYVEYKTISIVLHKDALPKEIRNKLNIK